MILVLAVVAKNTRTVMDGIYNKYQWTLTLILLAFMLEGCASFKEVSFERLYPAKVNLLEDVTRIAVINNAKTIKPEEEVVESVEIPNVVGIIRNTLWTNLVTEGIAQNMADANQFEVITLDSVWKNKAIKFTKREEFNELCNLLDVDLILILKESKITDTYYIQNINNESFRALIQGNIQNKICLYSPNNETNNSISIEDTLYWNGFGETKEDAIQTLPNSNYLLEDASLFAGEAIAKYLVPHWEKVTRNIFNEESPEMIDASIYAKKNQWEEARNVWQTIYSEGVTENAKIKPSSSKQILAAKAAYNIAISHELFGDLNLARLWIDKAINATGGKKSKTATWFVEYKDMLK